VYLSTKVVDFEPFSGRCKGRLAAVPKCAVKTRISSCVPKKIRNYILWFVISNNHKIWGLKAPIYIYIYIFYGFTYIYIHIYYM